MIKDELQAAVERLREYRRIAGQGTPSQRPAYSDAAMMDVYFGTAFTLEGDRAIVTAAFPPLTPEEAERAYDEAPAVPLSDERIAEIVAYATRGDAGAGRRVTG